MATRPRRPDGRPHHDGPAQLGFAHPQQRQLARALGWFGIGLGTIELIAPGRLARLIGVGPHATLLRALGLRELASGLGILKARRPGSWLWSRVAGDGMDLALLAGALASDRSRRGRVALAAAAVAGVAALDVLSSQQVSRHPRAKLPRRASIGDGTTSVEKSITVNCPREACYAFWRDFQNLPKFMQHLESVHQLDERRSHWVVKAPAGTTVQWDAQLTVEHENELLAWRSVEGADVDNSGTVHFSPGPGGRGTLVRVRLQYRPPGGAMGAVAAKLFMEEPDVQVQEDLRRFKRMMETGEIPTTEGQPSGQRSPVGRLFSKVSP